MVDSYRKSNNQGAAAPAGENTTGAKQTASPDATVTPGAGEPTPGTKQTATGDDKVVTPEVVTPEDTTQPKGKPAAGTEEPGNPASSEEARRRLAQQQQLIQYINQYEDPAKAKQVLAWEIINSNPNI